ncbi:MAG TPA: hypothetical protein VFJ91_05340 [Gaiellaceae bacterium]|nr:hypothetical protein [Gaiellaceae bacterium]
MDDARIWTKLLHMRHICAGLLVLLALTVGTVGSAAARPTARSWTRGPDLPQSWSEGFGAIQATEAVTIGGRVYLGGHDPFGRVFSFDPSGDGTWTLQSGTESYVDIDSGAAAYQGKLWLVGQAHQPYWDGGQPLGFDATQIYDPASDTWTLGPEIPGPARYQPQLAVSGGSLYAFGGRDGAPGNSDVYAGGYRLDGSSWTEVAPVPTPVADPAVATGPDGRIYLFGGVAGCPPLAEPRAWSCPDGAATSLVQVYDPRTNAWSTAAPMPTARYSGAAVRAGAGIYVMGGRVGLTPPVFPPQYPPSLATVELYDPVHDRWLAAPQLEIGRAQEAAARVDGEVWVFGGSPLGDASWTSERLTPVVPVSVAVVPAAPDGTDGWYRHAPALTVDSTPALLAPAQLAYGFDGASATHPYDGTPQQVQAPEGVHTLTVSATDGAGIASDPATVTLRVDTVAPSLSLAKPVRGTVTATAADATSGVARVEFGVVVAGGATVTLPADASAPYTAKLPANALTVTATAWDAAGNSTAASEDAWDPASAQFVIWASPKQPVTLGKRYVFWGHSWAKQVTSGDWHANDSFKGYAGTVGQASWSVKPGESFPPAGMGDYVLVIVSTSIAKKGSVVTGNIAAHALLRVDDPASYRPDPGHQTTGVVVAILP